MREDLVSSPMPTLPAFANPSRIAVNSSPPRNDEQHGQTVFIRVHPWFHGSSLRVCARSPYPLRGLPSMSGCVYEYRSCTPPSR
jgi:hypothetical protein